VGDKKEKKALMKKELSVKVYYREQEKNLEQQVLY
jgi:hypothetical protein